MKAHRYAQNIYAAALNAWRNHELELSPRSYGYRLNWLKWDTGATKFASKIVSLQENLYKPHSVFGRTVF